MAMLRILATAAALTLSAGAAVSAEDIAGLTNIAEIQIVPPEAISTPTGAYDENAARARGEAVAASRALDVDADGEAEILLYGYTEEHPWVGALVSRSGGVVGEIVRLHYDDADRADAIVIRMGDPSLPEEGREIEVAPEHLDVVEAGEGAPAFELMLSGEALDALPSFDELWDARHPNTTNPFALAPDEDASPPPS
jgi:hypothetical protein